MPSNFPFFEFVMVNLSALIFAFSVPLTIKWHFSKFSLFSLNQRKSGIDCKFQFLKHYQQTMLRTINLSKSTLTF